MPDITTILFESVADGLEDGTTPDQVRATIGHLPGSHVPSDEFWTAYDEEIGRLLDLVESIRNGEES